ncbi:MAG: hypothetical protein KJ944_08980 [Alphaproteobacteria bacterium]|jgi:hypothetical protein|uniref:hypothetical protein n=1 Tax=Devosia sp. XGJD_8 TaxID=3391187 RepID=UPI001DCFAF04|nr:hypothetical protein [Alphaproteobacteria bacterium]MBU1562311.1 hypothetical protein [Alphaproteobacteria bacterium]MBU2302717.1 hypothetical protein [Alphaproteobacteria bacterium]MBU2369286.1 hypothetical protein [Alphaproteobacteria bacterium]
MITTELKRIHPHERQPRDAVIVTVRRALGRTVADVAAVEVIADFPRPVPAALEAAESLRQAEGLKSIAVIVDDADWRPEWGKLV